MPSVLVDTGPLYAMADRDDDWHHRTVRFFEINRDDLIVPVSVLPERRIFSQPTSGQVRSDS